MPPQILYAAHNPSASEKTWYFNDVDCGGEAASWAAAVSFFERLRKDKGESVIFSGRKYAKTKSLSFSRHHIVDAAIWALAVIESPATVSHQEWVKPLRSAWLCQALTAACPLDRSYTQI